MQYCKNSFPIKQVQKHSSVSLFVYFHLPAADLSFTTHSCITKGFKFIKHNFENNQSSGSKAEAKIFFDVCRLFFDFFLVV